MKRKIVVIAALAAVCMLCVSFAACGDKNEYSGGYMSCLKSDAKLGEIVMLGAHDAGTVGQSDTACTQHSDFGKMLDSGVRYFDCRVTDVNGEPSFVHGNTNSVVRHRYFNVTSQHMRDTDHQWDYLYVPEATATHYFWDGAGALPQ